MTSLASFLFVAASVLGQADQPSPNYEHLKSLEFLIGDWEARGEVTDEVPGLLPKGTKSVGHLHFQWIWNKGAISWELAIKYETGFTFFNNGTVVWNPGTKEIVGVNANSLGLYCQFVWKHDAERNDWILNSSGIDQDGKTFSHCVHHILKDKDTLVVQITDQKVDGTKRPDMPEVKVFRVKPK